MNTPTQPAPVAPRKVFVPNWVQVGSPQDIPKAELTMTLWAIDRQNRKEDSPAKDSPEQETP